MSESKSTQFQFKFAGVEIEIKGEPGFVNRMYRTILADVERARTFEDFHLSEVADDDSLSKKIIWIHRCSEMMNKIYMSTLRELKQNKTLQMLDLQGVGVIYCDPKALGAVLKNHEEGQTLWAELTTQGKLKIAKSTGEKQ